MRIFKLAFEKKNEGMNTHLQRSLISGCQGITFIESLAGSPEWLLFLGRAFSLHSSLQPLLPSGTLNQGLLRPHDPFGVRGEADETAHQQESAAGKVLI